MFTTWWDRLGGRTQAALCGALFLALALAFLLVVFLYPENFLVTGADYQSHQFFLKTFLAESLRAGELPLWMPYICAGRPFAADPQAGVFYPFSLLYAVLPVPTAVTVLIFVHIAAAGFFCYLLARQLGIGGFGGLLAGVIYMFNGFLVTHAYRGQSERLEAMAYLPLIVFLVERAERTGRFRWYVWAGVAGGLQFLAGAPQIAWMTWVGVGVYIVARRACFWREGKILGLGRSIGGGLAALAVTAGLAAVQIVPTLELVRHSNRAESSVDFSGAFSFPPENVIHLFFPNYNVQPGVDFLESNPETSGYVGMLGMVLALVGLLRSPKRIGWVFGGVALLNVFIMLGPATPVFGALYYAIPGLSAFRLHSRAILMVTLCLAVWAGMGVDAMWKEPARARTRWLGMASAVGLLATVSLMARGLAQFRDGGVAQQPALWSAPALAVLGLAAVGLAGPRWREWVKCVWFVVVCLDLFYVGASMSTYRETEKKQFEPPASEKQILSRMQQDEGLFRFALPRELARENCGVLAHISGVNGFISLGLDRYYRFVHRMRSQPIPTMRTHTPGEKVFHPDNSFPFKVLNVRYSVGRDPQSGRWGLTSRDDYVPRAFLVSRFEVMQDDDDVLRAMRDPQFDPRVTVLLSKDPGAFSSSGAENTENHVEITEYAPRTIVLKAKLESDALLVLSEIDYPGWRAYVNGEEVPIHRADYLLRAIALKAGHYDRIVFHYAPESITIGLAISLASAVVVAGVLAASGLRRPTKRSVGAEATAYEPPAGTLLSTGRDRRLWTQIIATLVAGFLLPFLLKTTYPNGWAEVGDYLIEQGRPKAAAVALRRALNAKPDLDKAQFRMGYVLAKEGKLEQAADYLRQAIEANPESFNAHNLLGYVLIRQARFAEAVEHCRRATEIRPDFAQAHHNWAEALVAQGRYEEAAERFAEARRLSPGEPELYLDIAGIWTRAARYSPAIEVLREGHVGAPDNLDIADALAWLLATCPQADLRDGRQALRLATRACEGTAYGNPFMLRTLAAAHAQTGRFDLAVDVARQARRIATQAGKHRLADQLANMIADLTRRAGTTP